MKYFKIKVKLGARIYHSEMVSPLRSSFINPTHSCMLKFGFRLYEETTAKVGLLFLSIPKNIIVYTKLNIFKLKYSGRLRTYSKQCT